MPDGSTNSCWTLDAKGAAALLGIARSTFLSQHSAGRLPAPVRIGRRTLWLKDELRAWLEAGGPPRDRWEILKKSGRIKLYDRTES
jgi:predicted DNA-binding transcriptional regulator AlpA